MSDLVVSETVQVVGVGAGNKPATMRVSVTLRFDALGAQPNEMAPGMTMIVGRELQNAVERLLAKAKKAPRVQPVAVAAAPPKAPSPRRKPEPTRQRVADRK